MVAKINKYIDAFQIEIDKLEVPICADLERIDVLGRRRDSNRALLEICARFVSEIEQEHLNNTFMVPMLTASPKVAIPELETTINDLSLQIYEINQRIEHYNRKRDYYIGCITDFRELFNKILEHPYVTNITDAIENVQLDVNMVRKLTKILTINDDPEVTSFAFQNYVRKNDSVKRSILAMMEDHAYKKVTPDKTLKAICGIAKCDIPLTKCASRVE